MAKKPPVPRCVAEPIKVVETKGESSMLPAKKPLKRHGVKAGSTGLRNSAPLKSKQPLPKTTKPIAKPKKHTVSWYKKKADEAYSLAVRYRFSYVKDGERVDDCITCPTVKPIKQMQNGHFMSRQYNSPRYCDQNTGPQCYGCNVMHQGRQYEFGKALDDLYGAGTAQRMYELSKQPHQFKVEELQEIIRLAREEIAEYEQD